MPPDAPPPVADLVARAAALPRPHQADLLQADQRRRWRDGRPVPAEAYLPAVADDPETALVLIYGEVLLRRERGERPDAAEYAGRFPDHAAALAVQFDLDAALDSDPPDHTTWDHVSTPSQPQQAGPASPVRDIPGYEIQEEVGRGGTGVVYKARQVSLNRTVALKMLLAGAHAPPQQLLRFRQEAEILARLRHPNVVQIHEIGEHDGLPYLALEFVDGPSLARRRGKLGTGRPIRRAARLVEELARAAHAAHSQGVVHRDLKPANVLLGPDGTAKITDFGLARWTGCDAGLTDTGAVLGTPCYLAPEMVAAGRRAEAQPTTDVYGLGAILYELLTGRPPFQAATAAETLLQVMNEDPLPVRRLRPRVPRDLETVCHTALAREPDRRYPSAEALADDLRRWRERRPVVARPIGRAGHAWRWGRRNPRLAGLGAALAVAVVAGLGGVVWQWRAAVADSRAREEDVARAREGERAAVAQGLTYRKRAYLADVDRAFRMYAGGDLPAAAAVLAAHRPPPGDEDLRGFEWHTLWARCHPESRVLSGAGRAGRDGPTRACSVAFADGGRLLVFGGPQAVRVRDLTTGRDRVLADGFAADVWVAVSPDGATVAAADGDRHATSLPAGHGGVRLIDAASGAVRATLRSDLVAVYAVAFSPDGSTVAAAGRSRSDVGEVRLWDAAIGRERAVLRDPGAPGRACTAVAFAPDGKAVAAGTGALPGATRPAGVVAWDVATGRQRFAADGHAGPVLGVTYSADGRTIATAGADDTARLWDATTGAPLATFAGHTRQVTAAAFTPDRRRLVTASGDGTLKFWDLESRQEFGTLASPVPVPLALAFGPDARSVAVAGKSAAPAGEVHVWTAIPE